MATEVVKIRVELKGGKLAGVQIDGVSQKIKNLRKQMTLTQRIAKSLRGTMSTISKALISGFAISTVFGAIYTAINSVRTVFRLLKNEIVEGVMAVADFQEQTLTLSGIIATTVKQADNLEDNFRKAGDMARTVQLEFLKRTGEIIGTSKDAALVFQTLLGQGVAGLVNNMQEAVDLSILFTNAIIAVTPGQDKQRQLASETAAFLRGTVRATDRLAKLLGYTATDLNRIRDSAKSTKDFFQQIQPRLEAIQRASKEFGNTWTGLVTSSQDLIKILRLRVFTTLFEGIRNRFQIIRDTILDNIDKIGDKLTPIAGLLFTLFDDLETFAMQWYKSSQSLEDTVEQTVYTTVLLIEYAKELWKYFDLVLSSGGVLFNFLSSWDPLTGFSQANWEDMKEDWASLKAAFSGEGLFSSESHTIMERVEKKMEEIRWNTVVAQRNWELANKNAADLSQTIVPMREDVADMAKHAKMFADQMARIEQMRLESVARTNQNINPDLFPFADIDADMKKLAESVSAAFHKQGISPESNYWKETEEALRKLTEQRYIERISETTARANKEAERTALLFERARTKIERIGIPKNVLIGLQQFNKAMIDMVLGFDAPERLRKEAAAALRRARFQAKTGALGLADMPIEDQRKSLLETRGKLKAEVTDPFGNYNPAAMNQMLGDMEGIDEMIRRLNEGFMQMGERARSGFQQMVQGGVEGAKAMDLMKAAGSVVIAGIAENLATMLTSVMSGSESLVSALGKMVGQILIQMGQFLVTAGAMAVAAGTLGGFFPFLRAGGLGGPEGIPAGIAAMAAGAAAIAVGVAMGGSGNGNSNTGGAGGAGGAEAGMTTYLVDQKDVQVNAAINSGIVELNNTLGNMQAVNPGDVWTAGAKANGGVMTVASKEAARGNTASQTQSLGGAVTGGRG